MNLFHLLLAAVLATSAPWVLDLSLENERSKWRAVNDGVMGGLSRGVIREIPEGIRFEGRISLENNGGFASLRRPMSKADMSNYKGVTITYKCPGVKTAFSIEPNPVWYQPNYRTALKPAEEWTTVKVPFKDFVGRQVGRPVSGKLNAEKLNHIYQFGFITDEKREVDFALEVREVTFY